MPGDRVTIGGKSYQRGPMYVAWEAPSVVTGSYPVVLVHGGAVQGTEWLDTPDGRPGWAQRLVDAGYAVFVVDRPTQGRAPLHPDIDGAIGPAFSYEEARTVFFPDAAREEHTQWPIEAGDERALDAFVAAYGPLPADIEQWQRTDTARLAGPAGQDRPGDRLHSLGVRLGRLAAGRRPARPGRRDRHR